MRIVFLFLLFLSQNTFAWGKRGHALVGESAAYLLAGKDDFFKEFSYDMGYYCNVPDLIWKGSGEKIYKIEMKEHFVDLEIFSREMKAGWVPDRKEFEAKNPKVPLLAGRSYWRIHELSEKLKNLEKDLQKKNADKNSDKKHKDLQGQWLVLAGVIGHYIGDLAQPLHVTENYDGQMSGQKGVHSFFEEAVVNELYPSIAPDIFKLAQEQWPQFHEKNKDKKIFQLMQDLAADSSLHVAELLKTDKEKGRDPAKMSAVYRTLIVERIARGAMYYAEVISRSRDWKFNSEKFYFFDGKPDYIYPVGAK